jgi:hypothetical protein
MHEDEGNNEESKSIVEAASVEDVDTSEILPSPMLTPARSSGKPIASIFDNSPLAKVTKTKTSSLQLALPPSAFDESGHNFAQVIREKTKQRKLQEDTAICKLKVEVDHLEAAMHRETKRRVAAIQNLHELYKTGITDMETRINKSMQEEMQIVQEKLVGLEDRIEKLEQRWLFDTTAFTDKINSNNKEIKSQIMELQNTIQNERRQQKHRQEQLEHQIQELTREFTEKWQTERRERMLDLARIQGGFENVHETRQSEVGHFENVLKSQLAQLQADMEREVMERNESDEEIVQALNRYSKQLQDSLAAAAMASSSSSSYY